MLLYSLSTLYHSMRGRAKAILRKLDHHSIYLLIAGSYTPFCLVTLHGPWGWTLLGIVWSLAVIGSVEEFRPKRDSRIFSIILYALMGWMVLVALNPLIKALGPMGLFWLVAGGLFYTIGIAFYALSKRMTHAHGIWHLFVLAGSGAHYIAILRYVL